MYDNAMKIIITQAERPQGFNGLGALAIVITWVPRCRGQRTFGHWQSSFQVWYVTSFQRGARARYQRSEYSADLEAPSKTCYAWMPRKLNLTRIRSLRAGVNGCLFLNLQKYLFSWQFLSTNMNGGTPPARTSHVFSSPKTTIRISVLRF